MIIKIEDDFDLSKIVSSGQCFRACMVEDDSFRFITGRNILYIKKVDTDRYSISCTRTEWDSLWRQYFDLDRNYKEIITTSLNKNTFIDKAIEYGRGIRILRQDPWEMLITSITTQRKSIPAISKTVEKMSVLYGHKIDTEIESIYSFPETQDLVKSTETELLSCGLGYRVPYVKDAIKMVALGKIDLNALTAYSDEALLKKLCTIHGVGIKVASCVALFAYGRTACVPIDVWIDRVINEKCHGCSPFELYGEYAGIMQQYAFYYMLSQRKTGIT